MNDTNIKLFYTTSVLDFKPRLCNYQVLLDKNELAIAQRFKIVELRERYIINHGILRQLLAEHVGESAADLRIDKAEFGKPYLPHYPDLSFNLSHSGNTFALAISSACQLGTDVECYKERTTWEGMVKKCFASEEADYWYGLNPAERGLAFYQFWVKKEAFVKAIGKGISIGLDQCVINPKDLATFLRIPESAGCASHWQIHYFSLSDDIFGALVCDQKKAVVTLEEILLPFS